jgi:N-acetylglutamate synthase-like GNAT family acetyltransferase
MSLVLSTPYVNERKGDFLLSTDPALLDLDVIHDFLTNCYWAKGIARETVARSIENSLCFAVYKGKQQVAFARVVSDFATYAYIGDVFVLEASRGQGLSKWMMQAIIAHPALQGLRRWTLLTRDAHQLYSQFGFTPVQKPDRYMELHNPIVYEAVHS